MRTSKPSPDTMPQSEFITFLRMTNDERRSFFMDSHVMAMYDSVYMASCPDHVDAYLEHLENERNSN